MTEIRYDQAQCRMEIRGHAGAGEYGRDMVCAAESILMLTLEEALERQSGLLRPDIEKRPGEAVISCRAISGAEEKCREIMETIFTGYELLGDSFPDSVHARRINADRRGI